jgi:hypothetical protein
VRLVTTTAAQSMGPVSAAQQAGSQGSYSACT